MEPPRRRRRGLAPLLALASCLVLGSAALPASARAADGERSVERTTFETGLSGWRGHRAAVGVVQTRWRGRVAHVVSRPVRRPTSFSIYRRVVQGAEAGTTYSATGWIRSRSRGYVCVRLREVSGVTTVRRSTRCVRTNGIWQKLPTAALAKGYGWTTLRVVVYKRTKPWKREAFLVDGVEVAPAPEAPPTDAPTEPPTDGTPPPPPPDGDPPADAAPQVGTQFHCVWSHYSNAQRVAVLDKLQAAGVTWVRIDVGWYGIEDSRKGARNSWYLGMVDFCVDQARAHGMRVLVTLWATPGWANGGGSISKPPNNPADYADFARWAAEHFRGRVDAWEIWNEPDPAQTFWTGTTAQYVSMLKAAYPAIKAGDPAAQVVLGGPSSNDSGWISQVYSLGAKDSFDVLATHPYQGVADAPPETPTDGHRWWFTQLPAVRDVMLANGDGAKPIWFTEFGWSAHANWSGVQSWERGVTPEQQGDYFVRAIQYTDEHYPYVPVMFWYKERANPTVQTVHLEGYALLDPDLSERPVYGRLKSYLSAR